MEKNETTNTAEARKPGAEAATPQEDLERAKQLIKELCLPAWEAWSDELLKKDKRIANLPLEIFSEYSGATKDSPMSFMFLGFCGGYATGTLLAKEEEEKETV